MSVYSSQKRKRKDCRLKFKTMGHHDEFLKRITKTLYYGKLPKTERLSLPVTELAAELYSEVKTGFSLERLRPEEAAELSRNACVSPCSFVLAMLYLEQLKTCNPSYVEKIAPSELFLVSLLVASKFLNDCGEEDDVLNSEWSTSAGLSLKKVNTLEKEFLNAINWEIFIKEAKFWKTLKDLETAIALKEGKKRGWFTYTDLQVLMDYFEGIALAQAVFTVSAVCLASYTAGILTVIGSSMVTSQISSSCLSYMQPVNVTTYPNVYFDRSTNGSDFDCKFGCELHFEDIEGENVKHEDNNFDFTLQDIINDYKDNFFSLQLNNFNKIPFYGLMSH